MIIARIPVRSGGAPGEETGLLSGGDTEATTARLNEIYEAIYEGAESFLKAEYRVCFWFVVVFAVLIFVLVSWGTNWDLPRGYFTAISFLLGAFTSMASGYLGMKVAVYSNVRTTISAQKNGWTACFNTAFRAGAVMGKVSLLAPGFLHVLQVHCRFLTTHCDLERNRFCPMWHGNAHALPYYARISYALPQR